MLLSQLHGRSGSANQLIMEYVKTQLNLIGNFEDETVVSCLQFATKVAQELGPNLPFDFVDLLLGPGSRVPELKLSNSPQVLDQLVILYQTLLGENLLQSKIFK